MLASVSLVISLVSCGLAGFVAGYADLDLLPVQSEPAVASASQAVAIGSLGTVGQPASDRAPDLFLRCSGVLATMPLRQELRLRAR